MNNLENRQQYDLIAKTYAGLENILAAELMALGADHTEVINRAVRFTGDNELLYKTNYCCRSALRILRILHTFEINSFDDLYSNVSEFPWEKLFSIDKTFAVESVVSGNVITHSHFASLKTKDGIADRFRKMFNRRPSVDKDHPEIVIQVHVSGNKATLLLDSSGASLHKRSYRRSQGPAPLSEVLAAGMILLSGWDKNSVFCDPMCGSGTLLTEAALISMNIPSGYFRKEYAFKNWYNFDNTLWNTITETANGEICESEAVICGCDISSSAIEDAQININSARLHKDILITRSPFEKFDYPQGPGTIITNPPYGERLSSADLTGLYKTLGDVFKNKCKGYDAWIISSNLDSLKHVGLKPSPKLVLFNGPLECRFARFSIYEGSKKGPTGENSQQE